MIELTDADREFQRVKLAVKKLIAENKKLKAEIQTVVAERDYWRDEFKGGRNG